MKQKLIALVIFTAMLAVTAPASAQVVRVRATTTASTSPTKVETRAELEARKASSTQRRIDLHLDVAKKRAGQVLRVLNATVEKFENIIGRVESRIAKVKAEGGVVTEAETALASAKTHLSLAKASIATYASVEFTASSTVKDNFQRVRSAAADAKMHLRETHKALVEAVRSLKPGAAMKRATSTTATSTSQ